MIIIWGSKQKKKLMAQSGPYTCTNCNNVSMFQIIKISTWFTLFWIPLFPYSNKYYHVCPVCAQSYELTKEQANQAIAQLKASESAAAGQ